MSSPPVPGVGPNPQRPRRMMQFACPKCQTSVVIPEPAYRVFNHADLSVIAFSHTKLDKCPNCSQSYITQLAGVDPEGKIIVTFLPVETQQPIIQAPTQKNMNDALKLQALIKTKEN